MFERYNENARRTLFLPATKRASSGLSIEANHLLLGLVREGQEVTARIFADAAVSLPELRREIEQIPPPCRSMFRPVEIPRT